MSEETIPHLPNGDLKLILARFDSIDTRLTTFADKLNSIDARLTTLEEKVDRRLQETRPIWEQVLKRLDGVDARLEGVESELYALNRKFRIFNADILKLQDKQEDLEERVRKNESEPTQ